MFALSMRCYVRWLLPFCVLWTCVPAQSPECSMLVRPVTHCHLDVTLRAALKIFMDLAPAHDAIGSMTRLMFHDCMGPKEYNLDGSGPISICDGCLDLSNPAHSGLYEEAVRYLERLYIGRLDPNIWFYDKMSRADFWAAAATIALQYADELNTIDGQFANPFGADNPFLADSLPFIPFYIGRTDCSAAPDINQANYPQPSKSFPDALAGFGHNYDFFRDHYDFTVREYVAALGAHTLGNFHQEHSGFGDGLTPWVEEWWLLNNAFYTDLLDVRGARNDRDRHINWMQVPNELGSGQYEWIDFPQNRVAMINADIALVKDIDDRIINASTGEVSCEYHACPDNTETLPFVEMYHNDNQLWLDDFAKVITKMMLTGYDENELTILAPDGYVTTTLEPTGQPTASPSTAAPVTTTSYSGPTIACGDRLTGTRSSREAVQYSFTASADYSAVYLETCDSDHDTLLKVYSVVNGVKSLITEADDMNFYTDRAIDCSGHQYAGDIQVLDVGSGAEFVFEVNGYRTSAGVFIAELICISNSGNRALSVGQVHDDSTGDLSTANDNAQASRSWTNPSQFGTVQFATYSSLAVVLMALCVATVVYLTRRLLVARKRTKMEQIPSSCPAEEVPQIQACIDDVDENEQESFASLNVESRLE